MTERIIVEHRKRGGCLPVLAAVLVIGIAYKYWYVTVPVAVAIGGAVYWWRSGAGLSSTYECPRCHGQIPKGEIVCPTCHYDVQFGA